jgi:hypothetical protein
MREIWLLVAKAKRNDCGPPFDYAQGKLALGLTKRISGWSEYLTQRHNDRNGL